MKKSGYARVYRGIVGHPAFHNHAEEAAFMWLVVQAAWTPVRVNYKGRTVDLKRGQLAISVRDFARGFGWSKAKAERFFDRLKGGTLGGTVLRTDSGTGVNVITICNYSKYQAETVEAETPGGTKAGQKRDTEQGIKESIHIRAKTRAHTIPPDWSTPPIAELTPQARACAEKWPVGVYDREAEAFVNYWTGVGKPMKDWRATWRNRVVQVHSQIMREAERHALKPDAPKTFLQLVQEGKA